MKIGSYKTDYYYGYDVNTVSKHCKFTVQMQYLLI
jgi:hypothetical protein